MFIKSNCIFLPSIIHIPESCVWRIELEKESENGYDYCTLYLYVENKRFCLADAEDLCSGRSCLPEWAVSDLYEDIIDTVAEKLENNSNLQFIDIGALESELIGTKYQEHWAKKGYITIDENGHW